MDITKLIDMSKRGIPFCIAIHQVDRFQIDVLKLRGAVAYPGYTTLLGYFDSHSYKRYKHYPFVEGRTLGIYMTDIKGTIHGRVSSITRLLINSLETITLSKTSTNHSWIDYKILSHDDMLDELMCLIGMDSVLTPYAGTFISTGGSHVPQEEAI